MKTASRKRWNSFLTAVIFLWAAWLLSTANPVWAKPAEAAGDSLYQQARKSYYSLMQSRDKRTQRQEWIGVIRKFQEVLDRYPGSAWAYKATFTIGRLFHGLAEELGDATDFTAAIQYYRKLLTNFKGGNLSDDALVHLGNLHLRQRDWEAARNAYGKVLAEYPGGDQVSAAKTYLRSLSLPANKSDGQTPGRPESAARLRILSRVNSPQETRIVLHADGPVRFQETHAVGPRQIYFDFEDAAWSDGSPEAMTLDPGLVSALRLGREGPNSRLVLDLATDRKLRIQTRRRKNELVVVLRPDSKPVAVKPAEEDRAAAQAPAATDKQRPVVVVDAGHGGKDDGAHGVHGLLEKKINLVLARRVAAILEKRYQFKVILTRDDDTFLELKERGEIANRNNADLFVSIHANAAPRKSASGIETYYLGTGSSEQALETAARENGDLVRSVADNDVQEILASLISTTKINDSSRLAATVQGRLSKTLSGKYRGVNDLGVKEGPFFVLHDTNMPSILVEVGFVTNAAEERRLKNSRYQDWLAESIAQGIHDFLKQKAPAI